MYTRGFRLPHAFSVLSPAGPHEGVPAGLTRELQKISSHNHGHLNVANLTIVLVATKES